MTSSVFVIARLLGCLSAAIFSLNLTTVLVAQTGAPVGSGPPPIISIKREEHGRRANEAKLRSAELEADNEAETQKRVQAAITNMKQDFTRIQVLRNDIARNLVAKKPIDYNLITEQTSEINKRAHRLNVYMLAHGPEDNGQANSSDLQIDEMTKSLVKLCKLIDSFTENPALKKAATVDAQQIEKAKKDKAQADADLLAIIKLSGGIHRKAEALKTPK
ncbi:MAG TPA: hypothetical protein VJV03_12770 [Pyrinomonadaceae bacterium]|nr:hypothetical protein [Pyrinomonadaceae bacterium]